MYKLIGAGAEEILAKGAGSVAALRPILNARQEQMVAQGFAINATLRKDEWELVDTRVNDVLRERLTIVDDLRGKGLVTPVSIGTLLRVTERLDDMDDAGISFDGETPSSKDRPNFSRNVIPIPVISKDFTLNWRQLEASRTRGDALDVTGAMLATRRVRDRLQELITNGYGVGPGTNPTSGTDGQSIPGLTTAAGRIQVTLDTDWDESNADIIGDVKRMLEAAYAQNLFGPFFIYVPKNYWATLQDDYTALKGDKTYVQRILDFVDIEAVRPLDALADDNVVMVQMTEDVLDLSEAQVVTTVQWEKNPFVTNFRVLSIAGPQIKSIQTAAGDTVNGIVHLA